MGDVQHFDRLERLATVGHARVVRALRELADRLEAAPPEKLVHALPIAASAAEDLAGRLDVWLR
jgi:hypothetical protein